MATILAAVFPDALTTYENVPDVRGKNLDEARDTLGDFYFYNDRDEVILYSNSFADHVALADNWEVCEQSPAPGTRLAGGSHVKLKVMHFHCDDWKDRAKLKYTVRGQG